MRFHSDPVVRLADAKPVQLGHAARADGAWRIYAFGDASGHRLGKLANFLTESEKSPIRRFTPEGVDIDSVIDVRAVFQQGHRDLKVEDLPPILLPRKGRFGLIDYEKHIRPTSRTARTFSTCAVSTARRGRLSSFVRTSTWQTCFRSMRMTNSPPSLASFCSIVTEHGVGLRRGHESGRLPPRKTLGCLGSPVADRSGGRGMSVWAYNLHPKVDAGFWCLKLFLSPAYSGQTAILQSHLN